MVFLIPMRGALIDLISALFEFPYFYGERLDFFQFLIGDFEYVLR